MNNGRAQYAVERERQHVAGCEVVVSTVSGEIDVSVADEFAAAIAEGCAGRDCAAAVFDMERVRFIDSSGLYALLRTIAGSDTVPVAVVASDGSVVGKLLELSGLEGRVPRAADVEAAVQAVADPRQD